MVCPWFLSINFQEFHAGTQHYCAGDVPRQMNNEFNVRLMLRMQNAGPETGRPLWS